VSIQKTKMTINGPRIRPGFRLSRKGCRTGEASRNRRPRKMMVDPSNHVELIGYDPCVGEILVRYPLVRSIHMIRTPSLPGNFTQYASRAASVRPAPHHL